MFGCCFSLQLSTDFVHSIYLLLSEAFSGHILSCDLLGSVIQQTLCSFTAQSSLIIVLCLQEDLPTDSEIESHN
jgi:hypothetical protein